MWTYVKSTAALLYLIHAVLHTGRSESSGVDRCFPGWNHGRWILVCDYTSCGSPGGNLTHCKWFLLWRKIKLLGVSCYLKMMCLFPDKCEIKLLLKVGSWDQNFTDIKQADLVWRIFCRINSATSCQEKNLSHSEIHVVRMHFGFHGKWMVNSRGQSYL